MELECDRSLTSTKVSLAVSPASYAKLHLPHSIDSARQSQVGVKLMKQLSL